MNSLLIQQLHSNNIEQQQQVQKDNKDLINRRQKQKKGKCIVCIKKCNYSCPKCKKMYCGIEHYRSHNLFCSEEFYRNQVQTQLKIIKINDVNFKKKTRQMINNYQKQMDNSNRNYEICEERGEQILREIQQGREPKLNQKQQCLFDNYVEQLKNMEEYNNNNSNSGKFRDDKQREQLQIQIPYWQIEDGMGYYLLQQPQIEEYNESEHPLLIAERQLLKKKLQQFNLVHPYTQSVIKPIVNLHLISLIYTFVTLFRSYDGEYQQFMQILVEVYYSKQNENMLKNDEISIDEMIKQVDFQMIKYDNINNKTQNSQSIVQIWIKQNWQIILADLSIIINNKYLVLETLLRIVDAVNLVFKEEGKSGVSARQVLDAVNKVEQKGLKKMTKQQKHAKIIKIKMIKKCEYLIYLVTNYYQKQIYKAILSQISTIKQQKTYTNKII